MNNLKQISMALKVYESVYGEFPPAYTVDKDGKPLQSWRVLILPFLEQRDFYDQIHLDEPWDSPHNKALARRTPAFFRCPSDRQSVGGSDTDYFLVTGPGTVFEDGKAPKPGDFTRGESNTVLVVEASGQAVNWMKPQDIDVQNLGSLKSSHPGGVNAAMVDGSVQRIDRDSAPQVIRQLATGK